MKSTNVGHGRLYSPSERDRYTRNEEARVFRGAIAKADRDLKTRPSQAGKSASQAESRAAPSESSASASDLPSIQS